MSINLTVNGDTLKMQPGAKLSQLIAELMPQGKRLAVEINGEIVPRSQYASTSLNEGDRVEIVQAIGGG